MKIFLDLIFLFLGLYFLSFSAIGYGKILTNILLKKEIKELNFAYYGIFGFLFLIFISYFTNFFFSHNQYFNLFVHFLGFVSFFILFDGKFLNKTSLILLILIFLYFSFYLISKNHDDFPYYHFSLTLNLVEEKIQFGLGNLNLGYRHHSSIIHLMSLTYLPKYNFYFFNSVNFLFYIFIIFLLYENIKKNITKKNFIFFFSLFYFILINVKFKRLGEFGTDLSAQLLLIIIFINIYEVLVSNKNINNKYFIIFSLLFLIFTIKVTYVIYSIIVLILFLIIQKKKIVNFIFFNNRFSLFIILFVLLYILQNYAYTGCFVYPIAETCFFKDLNWTLDINQINDMKIHLESWAKAGRTPTYAVENQSEYIKGINWVSNWYKNYFIFKGIEFILLNLFLFIVISLVFFYPFKLKNKFEFKLEYKILFLINLIILLIWFFKHPSLRYGGYFPVSLFFALFLSLILSFFQLAKSKDLVKKVNILIILSLIIFNGFNYSRILKELKREDDYKFSNFPLYSIDDKKLKQDKINFGKFKINSKYGYTFYINE